MPKMKHPDFRIHKPYSRWKARTLQQLRQYSKPLVFLFEELFYVHFQVALIPISSDHILCLFSSWNGEQNGRVGNGEEQRSNRFLHQPSIFYIYIDCPHALFAATHHSSGNKDVRVITSVQEPLSLLVVGHPWTPVDSTGKPTSKWAKCLQQALLSASPPVWRQAQPLWVWSMAATWSNWGQNVIWKTYLCNCGSLAVLLFFMR